MNRKFFLLPQEKQERILRAGWRVFSQNSYKKSPMGEVAAEAGISKSLLFHYFVNKKEFYIFLWDRCAQITMQYLEKFSCYEQEDLFEAMYRGMQAKLRLMTEEPELSLFAVKAFYEKEEEIRLAIKESYQKYFHTKADKALRHVDVGRFIPGLDLQMMYREMYWASEGYLWEMLQHGGLDVKQMEEDFIKLLDFWKSVYLVPSVGD
ncbi:MAG: TetR/AcrR family transcriptional regulator [Lachnospiraceae bacterium]|nr:TetR/AcrR family transcriptional regulator [Lachnospiraceae bacterium]